MSLSLIELLYPPKCIFCEAVTEDGYICSSCEKSLPWTGKNSCVTKGDFFVRCVSPLHYKDNVRNAIHRYKFRHYESYGKHFAELIYDCVTENIPQKPDLITFVPLSFRRRLSRGYNQSQLMAEHIARLSGIPLYPVLRKTKHTTAQSLLDDASKRKANISGAYKVRRNTDITGLNILLIDDVVTTGSTLSECSRMLLMAGADAVYCATLAKAGKHN